MTDGTTLTRTSPLAELHPDAPITITRRQLERAYYNRHLGFPDNVPMRRRKLTAIDVERAEQYATTLADALLTDLQTAALQLQTEARECA